MPLGTALAVLTFTFSSVVVLLIGLDIPGRLHGLIDAHAGQDHLSSSS